MINKPLVASLGSAYPCTSERIALVNWKGTLCPILALSLMRKVIRATEPMAGEMRSLADEGEAASNDGGCAILYGIIRDCAYRIEDRASVELLRHRRTAPDAGPVRCA